MVYSSRTMSAPEDSRDLTQSIPAAPLSELAERQEPVFLQEMLASYYGQWVRLKDGKVAAASDDLSDLLTGEAGALYLVPEDAQVFAPQARIRTQLTKQPGYYLYHKDGKETIIFPLVKETTRIGRSLDADLTLEYISISRRHALILKDADGVRIVNDRSMNGVFVNRQAVDSQRLEDGDIISLGGHEFYFVDSTGD